MEICKQCHVGLDWRPLCPGAGLGNLGSWPSLPRCENPRQLQMMEALLGRRRRDSHGQEMAPSPNNQPFGALTLE